MTMLPTDDPRFMVAAARRILARNGCESQTVGHVSLRDRSGDSFWVTPFQYFDETLPTDICRFDFDLKPLEGTMETAPAVEFHSAIYLARPEIMSVAHLHSHYVTVFVSKGCSVGMYSAPSALFYRDQVVYDEDDGSHPPLEGKRVVASLGEKSVLLAKNHGAIIVGSSLQHATIKSLTLEQCARHHIESEAAGGTVAPEAESRRGKAGYERYYLDQMWEANLRRLRKSDPDLFVA
jgi:L-fuculose-phosphate aldolase